MVRPNVFVLVAGLIATIASYMVYSVLKTRDELLKKQQPQLVAIAVATRNLPLGSKLDSTAIAMVPWPRDHLPAGAITDPAALRDRIVKVSIAADQPIVKSALYDGAPTSGLLPLMIPPGMRAMSVPVDEVSGVAGFVMPHARVDVLVAIHSPKGTESPKAKIVLENVEVLAIAQELEGSDRQPQVVRVVTLLVTPDEAERLALASREGTLRLAIRRYDDQKLVNTSGTDLEGLLRAYSNPVFARAQVRRSSSAEASAQAVRVEVMRGAKARELVSFIAGTASLQRRPKLASDQNGMRVSQAQSPSKDEESSSFMNSEVFGPGAKTIEVGAPVYMPATAPYAEPR